MSTFTEEEKKVFDAIIKYALRMLDSIESGKIVESLEDKKFAEYIREYAPDFEERMKDLTNKLPQLLDNLNDEENAYRDLNALFREQAAWLDAPGRLEKHDEYLYTQKLNRLKSGLKLSEPSPSEAKEIELDSSSHRRRYEKIKKEFEKMKSEVKRMEREEAAGTWKSSVKSLQKQIIEILKERGEELDMARIMEGWMKHDEQKKE